MFLLGESDVARHETLMRSQQLLLSFLVYRSAALHLAARRMSVFMRGATPASPVVLWLRNDLRLRDNDAVHLCAQRVGNGQASAVLPVFVFDERWFGPGATDDFGNARTGVFRARFLREAVEDLRANLKSKYDQELLVACGKPEEVLPKVVRAVNATEVVAHGYGCWEERRIESGVKQQLQPLGATLSRVWGHTMHHIDDLPPGATVPEIRGAFTNWRKKVEGADTPVRRELPEPAKDNLQAPPPEVRESAMRSLTEGTAELPSASYEELPSLKFLAAAAALEGEEDDESLGVADERGVLVFKGGETAALERLEGWMFDRDNLKDYFDTRNGMLGSDYSSKFSPWLACGSLSPRTVYWACKRYEATRVENKSTYWLVFELLWRDFFHFLATRMQGKMFMIDGEGLVSQDWIDDPIGLQKWREGKTGHPLIDANMRELQQTGFMSNRGRQNVASFLALDLRIDWRRGGSFFEEYLLDYDPASNWGNWHAAAGLNGGRVNRFNIAKQSKDYDPTGAYIRTWCPELKDVPIRYLFEPWTMPKDVMAQANCQIGVDYPNPLRSRFQPPMSMRGGGGDANGGGGRRNRNRGRRQRSDRRRS
eukprot:scaffold7358_cov252-Pinguiococcus_pyrenoidosus.AAC.15